MLSAVGFSSCKNDDVVESPKTDDPQVSMEEYESKVFGFSEQIINFCVETKKSDLTTRAALENQSYQDLKKNLLPTANQFVKELGLSSQELESILGHQILTQNEQEDALVGILLFAVATNSSNIHNEGTRASAVECFQEATGIAAGVAIVGGLAKGVISKKILMATIELAAKVGGRTLSGIGLALIAGEMIWCMSR